MLMLVIRLISRFLWCLCRFFVCICMFIVLVIVIGWYCVMWFLVCIVFIVVNGKLKLVINDIIDGKVNVNG